MSPITTARATTKPCDPNWILLGIKARVFDLNRFRMTSAICPKSEKAADDVQLRRFLFSTFLGANPVSFTRFWELSRRRKVFARTTVVVEGKYFVWKSQSESCVQISARKGKNINVRSATWRTYNENSESNLFPSRYETLHFPLAYSSGALRQRDMR